MSELSPELRSMLWPFAFAHDDKQDLIRLTIGFNNWAEVSCKSFENVDPGELLHAILTVLVSKAVHQHGAAEVKNFLSIMYSMAENPLPDAPDAWIPLDENNTPGSVPPAKVH